MKVTDVLAKPTLQTVIKFVANSPADELYSRRELTDKFGVAESTLRRSTNLHKYAIMYGEYYYYGSPKAVENFKKLKEKNEN